MRGSYFTDLCCSFYSPAESSTALFVVPWPAGWLRYAIDTVVHASRVVTVDKRSTIAATLRGYAEIDALLGRLCSSHECRKYTQILPMVSMCSCCRRPSHHRQSATRGGNRWRQKSIQVKGGMKSGIDSLNQCKRDYSPGHPH
jgi:hypothetical protein